MTYIYRNWIWGTKFIDFKNMSLLDIDIDKIDLGVVKFKLNEYMRYHYGSSDHGRTWESAGYINAICHGNFELESDVDITEKNLGDLVMYYLFDSPHCIHVTRKRVLYKRGWFMIYAPIHISERLRLLTLNDVLNL